MTTQNLMFTERMVLLLIASGKYKIQDAKKKLRRDYFIDRHDLEIYDTLVEIDRRGDSITPNSFIEELIERESLDAFGGEKALRDLISVAKTHNIDKEMESLKNIVNLRQIRELANKPSSNATDPQILKDIISVAERCKAPKSEANLDKQLDLEQNETVESFLDNHKATFSSGVLLSGFQDIDKRLFYVPGDLVIVQGMSNHGKTKWMEEKAYRFITNERNAEKNPVCVFISFENSPLFVKQDFLNLISKHENEGDRFIAYDSRYTDNKDVPSPFLYPDTKRGFQNTISTYEKWKKNQSIIFLENVQFEDLNQLASKLKERHEGRPIAIFLDYIQIVPNNLNSDGWEKIKEISYGLEKVAQQNKVIVIAGSQVNEKRETREGKDVYNAATIVEDVFNHSHPSLEMNEALKSKYTPQINGQNVVSITITKYKRGSAFALNKALCFDGYSFKPAEHKPESAKTNVRTSTGSVTRV